MVQVFINTQPLCNESFSLSHNGIIVDFSDLKSNSIELDQNVKAIHKNYLIKYRKFQREMM